MPFGSVILIAVAILNSLFAGVIAARNYKSRVHLLFVVTIFFNILWAVGDAIMVGVGSTDTALAWSKLFFIAPMLTVYYLILFAYAFPDNQKLSKEHSWLLFTPIAFMGTLIAVNSNYLISGFNQGPHINEFVPVSGNFLTYTIFFSAYFTLAYVILFLKQRKSTGLVKTQLSYILIAAIGGSLPALISNLSLPYLGDSAYVWIGPVTTVFYVAVVTYSIAKHRLFDIRLLVVRALAYAMTFGSVLLLFGLGSLLLSNTIITFDSITSTVQLFYLALAMVLGVLYQPIKKYFDKMTNATFYRDAYDSQEIIDELTSILATQMDLDSLVGYSSNLVNKAIRPTNMRFVVFEKDKIYLEHTLGDTTKAKIKLSDLSHFNSALVTIETANASGKKLMDKLDTEVILRLEAQDEIVGAVLLGPKHSGSSYDSRDIDLLRIGEKELAIAVQNSRYFEQIQKFNATLQKEIEEATGELKRSNTKLKALDEAKDEFVSMASHQLRTPLTSVKGYISMILEGDVGKTTPQQHKLLEEAFASSQRMVYLIADLLNVSRLRTGKFVIEKSEIDLPRIIHDEVSQLQPTARTRGLNIEYVMPKSFPKLVLDETKIRQVVMNFIDNAIYYTRANGKVTVQLYAKKDSIEFRVSDTGIGVPRAEQHKLFTKFFRADNARKVRPDGTGLGLYMAQKVVSSQGGSVIFESEEGKGSTFGFHFPMSKVKPKKPAKKSAKK